MYKLIELDEIDSTNNYVKAANLEPFTAVTAKIQTAGRGRSGRVWESCAYNKNIALSVVLPPVKTCRLFGLQIAMGYAAVEALNCYTDVYLKWPNDLVVYNDGKVGKLGGILLETNFSGNTLKQLIVGIGVNVNSRNLPENASSLALLLGKDLDIKAVTYLIIKELIDHYHLYNEHNLDLKGLWPEYSFFLDEKISFYRSGKKTSGIERGITDNGFLIFENHTGKTEEISEGEVGYDFSV